MKRKREKHSCRVPDKRQKFSASAEPSSGSQIVHPVLSKYYTRVIPLRGWLLLKLAKTSQKRQKALEDYGRSGCELEVTNDDSFQYRTVKLLDGVLVGTSSEETEVNDIYNEKDIQPFSQHVNSTGRTNGGSSREGHGLQMFEIVDFATWLLFNKTYKQNSKPPHMLCQGLLRASTTWQQGNRLTASSLPGLTMAYPNEHAEALKRPEWSFILALLGDGGDRVMIDLLVSCGLFYPIDRSHGSYYQLSGTSLAELKTIGDFLRPSANVISQHSPPFLRTPAQIRIVRNRILYARAAFNAKREVAFGLRHIHVLNRYSDPANPKHTAHIIKYMFPRQFGLHNVFTSFTDSKETVQPFQDYTLRETEIAQAEYSKKLRTANNSMGSALPKRLRGALASIVQKLQKLHVDCSYSKLLAHYCSVPGNSKQSPFTQQSSHEESMSFVNLATSSADVSAFCRAVLARILPPAILGDGVDGTSNWTFLFRNVDRFVKARRFESFTLEAIMKNMKITAVSWLRPPHLKPQKMMSMSDFLKRQELLAELQYYIFDSLVIPLIRTNFHVTESSMHRNRLFFFRHDVWRRLTEPALTSLKANILEELGDKNAFKLMKNRTLGFSQVRLLPKTKGMRPITNLRRRMQVTQNGRKFMAKSINSSLAPAFSVLNLEKTRGTRRLGASLFSVADIYPKLQAFRARLVEQQLMGQRLYFVKVDVKSCFDSLPQQALIRLVERLVSSEEYSISKYAQLKPAESTAHTKVAGRPTRTFTSRANVGLSTSTFVDGLPSLSNNPRPNGIFVDGVVPQMVTRSQVLQLLTQHIQANVIRIGKKYYRQKQGIAQGSVVSSLLCNLFFAEMETQQLSFIDPNSSSLVRLIDDFLLVTTDRQQAFDFLDVMHAGIPSYGISVKPEKSLVNFQATINGIKICRPPKDAPFPYCGLLIDTEVLNITKDKASVSGATAGDSLTVEYCKLSGANFRSKMLASLKIQLHTMLLDTSHNARRTVYINLHQSMLEVARKMLQYSQSLDSRQRPSASIMARTIGELCALAYAMMRSKRNRQRNARYECAVGRAAVQWITASAFVSIVERRQAALNSLLTWLKNFKDLSGARIRGREQSDLVSFTSKLERQP